MPATSLTPAIVDQTYRLEVSQADIDDAATAIHNQTGRTVDEHVDERLIPDGSVGRAWAIVARRIRVMTANIDAADVGAETAEGFTHSLRGDTFKYETLMAGPPSELLAVKSPVLLHQEDLPAGPGRIQRRFRDDYGVVHRY